MDTHKNISNNIDISDISLWHLVLTIAFDGIDACFFNPSSGEKVDYLQKRWNCDESELANTIQDIIYDNPILLEGYHTSIIIESQHFLIVPTSQISDEEDSKAMLDFICPSSNKDIYSDSIGDITFIFSFVKGLKSFLYRTFGTENIYCHLSAMTKSFINLSLQSNNDIMFGHLRKNKLDIFAYHKGNLKMANTFDYKEVSDAAYFILNAWEALGFDQQNGELKISGNKEQRELLMPTLRQYINYVMLTTAPESVNSEDLPTSCFLSMHKIYNYENN